MKNLAYLLVIGLLLSCNSSAQQKEMKPKESMNKEQLFKVTKTEAEWKAELTPEQFAILRNKGTERPHTGAYNLHFEKGAYACAACGAKLFDSDAKFKSNCGWPSFDNAIEGSIVYKKDTSLGMVRTEILCANCGGHLGHIFDDGPTDTGKRYCVNSASLDFSKQPQE